MYGTADFENAGDYFFAGKLLHGPFQRVFERVKKVKGTDWPK
jgi:hypothetical protein